MSQNLSSAAVVVGALRVKLSSHNELILTLKLHHFWSILTSDGSKVRQVYLGARER